MHLQSIGEIMAIRELYLEEEQGQKRVLVSIGKPQKSPELNAYYCPFQISGLGRETVKYAAGIDGIQALQLALVMIGASLQFLSGELGGKLGWEGNDEGGLGFPTSL